MKMSCPICHLTIIDVTKEKALRVAECKNQCLRVYYDSKVESIIAYTIRMSMEGKDYLISSRRMNVQNQEEQVSTLRVYGKNTEGYGYSTIATLERYFEPEEVFPNPKRLAERLLKLKAFA